MKVTKSGAGLALPDLEIYFEATQIKFIMVRISDINVPWFKEIEINSPGILSFVFNIHKRCKEEIKLWLLSRKHSQGVAKNN